MVHPNQQTQKEGGKKDKRKTSQTTKNKSTPTKGLTHYSTEGKKQGVATCEIFFKKGKKEEKNRKQKDRQTDRIKGRREEEREKKQTEKGAGVQASERVTGAKEP